MPETAPDTVVIRIPARWTAKLRSPGRSLTDGSQYPVLVQTWTMHHPFHPRRLTLAVDAATARQVKRYNWIVAALLVTCVVAVLVSGGYMIAVVLSMSNFLALLLFLPALSLVAGLGVVVTTTAWRWRPGIYPRASTYDEILMFGVERGAAEEWRGVNDPGVLTIVEPGR
ncbi:hypothetical protein [Dactylosporangium sp. NPDC051484]|uniref:hypothetical protein n=1 Tax=Dactylosporangium sp. NPDC051484 TaxID=3154942 RepID=UPI00344EDBBD